MTTALTLNALAADAIGHYGNASNSLISAYGIASARALAATSSRYAELVERTSLPLVGDEGKARMVAAGSRVAGALGEGLARSVETCDRAVALVFGQALKGLEAFAQRTDWAKDMFVVEGGRRVSLPAAKLSLEIANRIDAAASAVSTRAAGSDAQLVAKPAVKKQKAQRIRREA